MAHFDDGTPYTYATDTPEHGIVNVGWLEAGRAFAQSPPSPALVEALLRCALRPVELYRGYHTCDLCPESSFDMPSMFAFGRSIMLGNGEVRVTRDGLTYAAPTLVAHYVAVHAYAPPTAFVDGVHARAATIPVAAPNVIAAVEALDAAGRRERAWRVAERAAVVLDNAEATAALAAARAGRPARHAGPFGELLSRVCNVDGQPTGAERADGQERRRLLEIIEWGREIGVQDD